MNALDLAYINRNLVSWADLRWLVTLPDFGNRGGRLFGFHSLAFGGEKRERPPQWGQNRSQAPIGLPSGKYTPPNPKIGWLAHAADADSFAPYTSFNTLLRSGAPQGPSGLYSIGNVRMNWTLQVLNNGVYVQYAWYDVYLVGKEGTWEETAEGLKLEEEFTCTRFITNDTTLYDSTEE
jgi:hypothetical protein